jgi:Rrf2 family protein
MKISTKGRYALEALLYMAHSVKNEPVAIRVVAENTGISEKYLEQLFFLLRKTRIIDTLRGPKGGYFIARDLEEVTAGEIVRAVEGDLVPVPCVADPEQCASSMQGFCVTRTLWQKVSDAVIAVLDSATLASLVEEYRKLLQGSTDIGYYI